MLQRVAVIGHMVVAIDQAGQHRLPRHIDDFGVGRPVALIAGGDRLDAIVAKDDRRVLDRRGAGAVDQPATFQDLHRFPPPTADADLSRGYGRKTPAGDTRQPACHCREPA